jgi:hypothetical protein
MRRIEATEGGMFMLNQRSKSGSIISAEAMVKYLLTCANSVNYKGKTGGNIDTCQEATKLDFEKIKQLLKILHRKT